jgi:hypothetical protein
MAVSALLCGPVTDTKQQVSPTDAGYRRIETQTLRKQLNTFNILDQKVKYETNCFHTWKERMNADFLKDFICISVYRNVHDEEGGRWKDQY